MPRELGSRHPTRSNGRADPKHKARECFLVRRSPPSERLQHQAGFIQKHQASFSFEPLFLVEAKFHVATEQSLSRLVRGSQGGFLHAPAQLVQ